MGHCVRQVPSYCLLVNSASLRYVVFPGPTHRHRARSSAHDSSDLATLIDPAQGPQGINVLITQRVVVMPDTSKTFPRPHSTISVYTSH